MKQASAYHHCRPTPGIVVAALHGGSGKTIFSVGIIAALKALGKSVAPFKKGPDYIDAGWLALAAGRPCYNLDTFLIDPDILLTSYHTHTQHTDFSLIEGNRGIYDCIDTAGETSTAELAKLLGLPVILCVDATKTTRTMAAIVGGIVAFDPDVRIAGVILNRTAGKRHQGILTQSIETYTGVPVLGAVPKLRKQEVPERHMGLVPTAEHGWAAPAVDAIREAVATHLDLDRIVEVAGTASPILQKTRPQVFPPSVVRKNRPIIGVFQDSAFQFYYPENLEALEAAGADLVFLSPLRDAQIPVVDALYVGGGFPETHARELEANTAFRMQMKTLAQQGLPIYAECGGLMYLGDRLVLADKTFAMTGILPLVFGFSERPRGHGYTIIQVDQENPYYPIGTTLRGHEFHYSGVDAWTRHDTPLVFQMVRGTGITDGRDGICCHNVLATYTHIHALGTPEWAPAMVGKAASYRKTQQRVPMP
ncbi:cobyrinate a,c-diamide synthase [Desulfosarcina sp. OttesenSCG-928-A07]|nr:cobyrinate a,c-diamide synthase [Desulfosarcina sp. OttesenSCG-928-G17]MDL2328791.1 cobyrinate a,c-diamide synthase [Desulfosarcina sp. OttesenSCG-928-A07]